MRWFALGLLSMAFGSVVGLAGGVFENRFYLLAGWMFRFGGMVLVGQSVRSFRGFRLWPGALTLAFLTLVAAPFFLLDLGTR